jgi:predicted nucleic acid-binding protein
MLLDTDILIDLLRGKVTARNFLLSLAEDAPHCCSVVTVAEIYSGMRETERQKTSELIESLIVVPVTKDIAVKAGEFRRVYRNPETKKAQPSGSGESKKIELELDDCLIAATAACEGLELVTGNTRHYPMPEVRVKAAIY